MDVSLSVSHIVDDVELAVTRENCNHHRQCENCAFHNDGGCSFAQLKKALREIGVIE